MGKNKHNLVNNVQADPKK